MHILEVPEVVMRALSLRNLIMRLWLSSVNDIWELNRILDKKHGNIVSDDIPVTLIGIELQSKSTDITNGIGRTSRSKNSRETNKHRSSAGGIVQDIGTGELGDRSVELEVAMDTSATGVDNTFRNTFMVNCNLSVKSTV